MTLEILPEGIFTAPPIDHFHPSNIVFAKPAEPFHRVKK